MHNTILFSLIIIFIYIFLFLNRNNVIYIETYTGTKYLVANDNMKQDAANLLDNIVKTMFKLKKYLYEKIKDYPDYASYIKQLNDNLNEDKTTIYETDPNTNLTSYSVNKGEEVAFCLKSKKTGQLHDINLMTYVALHEMAHIGCPETGHGELFKKVFKFLTERAIELNLYKKIDYNVAPVEYCGMTLSSSIV
jgi:predicted metal-dependent hydrolase